jgi:hypothetical protein
MPSGLKMKMRTPQSLPGERFAQARFPADANDLCAGKGNDDSIAARRFVHRFAPIHTDYKASVAGILCVNRRESVDEYSGFLLVRVSLNLFCPINHQRSTINSSVSPNARMLRRFSQAVGRSSPA